MFSTALATKLFASPLLIGLASLAGKRWGPAAAGLLGGLPLVALPLLVVLWLEGGSAIALRVALTAPVGVWATMSYLLVFGFASRRFGWAGTLAIGWLAYLALASLLHFTGLDRQHWLGAAVLPMLLLAARYLLPLPQAPASAVHLPPSELLLRMLSAVLLVSALAAASAWLGPEFTGVLSAAPVAATVIPAFTLAVAGHDATLRALRGFLVGQMGFAVFFLVLAALMPALAALALLPAAIAAVLTSFAGLKLLQRLLSAAQSMPGRI